jgi:hypothetical protein
MNPLAEGIKCPNDHAPEKLYLRHIKTPDAAESVVCCRDCESRFTIMMPFKDFDTLTTPDVWAYWWAALEEAGGVAVAANYDDLWVNKDHAANRVYISGRADRP